MAEISCVGILTADVLAKPVDQLPEKGLLSRIDSIHLELGGCAANAAIDLAKLGAKVQIFGKVGRDSLGEFVRNRVQAAGVDVKGLKTSEKAQTSASVVTISEDGERSVIHCVGANAEFSLDDIDIVQIQKSKILLVAGSFLLPVFDGVEAAALLKEAKQAGVLCCLDTAWDTTGLWMDKLGVCMSYLDWFMPSYEEAVQLSGQEKPAAMAEYFQELGARNVVIKLGGDGCYIKAGAENGFYQPAYQDVQPVDTSGAGDSFCAGFLLGLAEGWRIAECAAFANAVGAMCVMSMGTTTGIGSKEETLEFMAGHR